MSTLREIKVLHLESTDVCQAACPLCARETDVDFNKSQQHHLTVEKIAQHLSESDIAALDKMFMCGNYGDPAAGKHTLEIYQHFRKINPGIVLGMNTNGAIRSQVWWRDLAAVMHQSKDYVVFSIDGLEDTNHVYRVNVSWTKLMRNVQAFIKAGGSAHWDMLVYKHNQHQVDEAIDLAKIMGFTWFRAKISKRSLAPGLERSIHWQLPQNRGHQIRCHALVEKSMYIDAQGKSWPCCWLGSQQREFIADLSQVQQTWNSARPHPVCKNNCTITDSNTTFQHQWQKEIQLR